MTVLPAPGGADTNVSGPVDSSRERRVQALTAHQVVGWRRGRELGLGKVEVGHRGVDRVEPIRARVSAAR